MVVCPDSLITLLDKKPITYKYKFTSSTEEVLNLKPVLSPCVWDKHISTERKNVTSAWIFIPSYLCVFKEGNG